MDETTQKTDGYLLTGPFHAGLSDGTQDLACLASKDR